MIKDRQPHVGTRHIGEEVKPKHRHQFKKRDFSLISWEHGETVNQVIYI